MTRAHIFPMVGLVATLSGCRGNGFTGYIHTQHLIRNGQFEAATTELVALWQDRSQGMAGVRRSFVATQIGEVVGKYPPARVQFAEFRDAATPGEKPDPDQLSDWMVLNKALGETSKTLVWFDTATVERADPRYSGLLELQVVPPLIAANRWKDAGRLYKDPVRTLNGMAVGLGRRGLVSWIWALAPRDIMVRLFRDDAAQLVRALHAAGRNAESGQVAAEARKIDPSPEMDGAMVAALKQNE